MEQSACSRLPWDFMADTVLPTLAYSAGIRADSGGRAAVLGDA